MASKEMKDNFDKVCSQGQQIQKTLKYHQNKLKSMFSNPKTDSTVLEAALNKLATLYSELDGRINQDYPQLKFSFFPSNMDVSYSVKYAGGTFPDDLTLCHNRKSKLKEIRSSLKRKIISKELSKVSCVEERDCVIAVDMKRMVVRAVVIGVTHQIVKLLDIDTGDYKNAVVDNIYELDEEAVSLYALCVRCGLDGDLTHLKEFWTADLSHYFISALNYGELVIETSHDVDESCIPPRFKVTIEVFVDETKVLNVNQWVCNELLPLVKKEAQNCLDLQKVIQGLNPKVLMPYLLVASGVSIDSSSNLSDSCVCSSQIISSPESSARSSSSESSEEYSVDIQIDKFDTPSFLPSPSAAVNGPPLSCGKKEIDVYFTNENMVASPSSESLVAERSKSKCDCGTNCAPIVGCCPPELLQSNPKVPRITTVIPSLARIPNGEPFYYKMKNKSKSSLLPTPSTTHTNTSGDINKSETELRTMESAFYNKSNGRLPPDGFKHRSDNSLSCSTSSTSPSHLPSSSRRGPRSHLYTLPLPSYMTEADGFGAAVNASAGDAFVGGVVYPEEKLVPLSGSGGSGPNSRGEGLSLKPQHFCLAGHLEKVQSVKLPRSVLLVEPGQVRKALISFTETPSKFFVNIVDENNAHLEQLEEELCAHYSQVNNLVSLVTIEEARYHLGDYVAAKWKSDGRWYRARVIDWNVYAKNSIAIFYVDHGNVDLVPLDYIQPLDPHFTQYAIMALPCHLAHLSPSNSSGWSQEAIDMFSQFCDKPLEVFYLTFQPSSSNDSSCSWSVVMRNAQGECINDFLVSAGHAIHTGKINGHAAPASIPPAPVQPPKPTPPTPAPDRGHHPILSRIQGLVKQIQNKNATINSVFEGNTEPETPELCIEKDSEQIDETRNQFVPETCDTFDNNHDLIDLNNVDEQHMEYHDVDINTTGNKHIESCNTIDNGDNVPQSTLIESNDKHYNDISNSNQQIPSCSKPNLMNSGDKESESHDLSIRGKQAINSVSEILPVSESYVSASLSLQRHLNSQLSSCDTNIPASTVRPISYEADSLRATTTIDIPIPGLEEDLVERSTTEPSHEIHGRLSRNSNISCVSSEGLALVEQMLNKCNEDIEKTSQRLSKAFEIQRANAQLLVDNEKKLIKNERKLGEIGTTLVDENVQNDGLLVDVNHVHDRMDTLGNTNELDNVLDVNNLHSRDMFNIPRKDETDFNNLDKDVGDVEVKELIESNKTKRKESLNECKELNVPRTEPLNNIVSERNINIMKKLNNTSSNNGERIVNQLKSPSPHVPEFKNTNYKKHAEWNPSSSNREYNSSNTNQYQTNTEYDSYNANLKYNQPNTKPYISQLEFKPSHYPTYHDNYTPYRTNEKYPANEKEEESLSGIVENLNENLLVSSSDSSVRRGKLPSIIKKPSQRKLVQANFSTILTRMPADEVEKQKMIEQFVQNSQQQAKQSRNIVNDNVRDEYENNVAHENKITHEIHINKQISVHLESRKESGKLNRDNKQGSNDYNQECSKDQNIDDNTLNVLGANKNLPHDLNLNETEYNVINQLEQKEPARLNNQLEPIQNDQDRTTSQSEPKEKHKMLIDQDKMCKDPKIILKDDQDGLQNNANRISSYHSNQLEPDEENIIPVEQDRPTKDQQSFPLSEELVVKKKNSSRGRPRKYSKHADDPAGPSLKSLAQKRNIFECLNQASNSNSADVSSEETSAEIPSSTPLFRPSKPKPHKTETHPSALTNSKNKSNPNTLSNITNNDSKNKNTAEKSNPTPSPSVLSNASSKSFITHKPGNNSEEAASKSKTQKWFWLTLQQETLSSRKLAKPLK
ncbi:hypothetical protein WDU94_013023 [Cyamophila willieti]